MTYEKVLGEFGADPKRARAAYCQFVSAGVGQKPASPFSQAFRGVLVGSETFVERVREMLSDCEADPRGSEAWAASPQAVLRDASRGCGGGAWSRRHRLGEGSPLGKCFASGCGLSGASLLWLSVHGCGRRIGLLECRRRRLADCARRGGLLRAVRERCKSGQDALLMANEAPNARGSFLALR